MKKGVLALFLSVVCLALQAQESQTAYNFLRLPVSAHGAALGGQNISLIEDDPSLIFSNPALMSSVSDRSIGLNFMNYMVGANTASASYCWEMKERLMMGFSGQYMDYGKMKETDANNVETGEFSAKEISLAGYLSYNLTERLVGGITAKWVSSYIADYNSIAMCVDLGLNYYDPDHDLSVSAVAKNLGGQLKAFDDEYERLPFELQAGVTKRLQGAPLRLSATLQDLTNWDYKLLEHLCVGAELLLSDQIWVGGGLNFRRSNEMKVSDGESESSHGAGLTLGGGVMLDRFKLNVSWGKYHVSSSSVMVNAAFNI